MLAHRRIEPELQSELGATPLFRRWTYHSFKKKWRDIFRPSAYKFGFALNGFSAPFRPSTNAVAKCYRSFELAVAQTVEDLTSFEFDASDVIYFNSAQAVEFAATIAFLSGIPELLRPRVYLEFGLDPGVWTTFVDGKRQVLPINPFVDPRAKLYQIAASFLSKKDGPLPVRCVTFESNASKAYATLIGYPVATLPLPGISITDRHSRVGANPITISVLGHQRRDKGYQLVADIISKVLAAKPNVRFLVHNGAPAETPGVQQILRDLASNEPRIIIDERTADENIWRGLLQSGDLILCPYEPNRFRTSYSAVAAEAVAEAIPIVVPSDTSLSDLAQADGAACVTFDEWGVESIAAAVIKAVECFDDLARKASTAATRWPLKHGPDRVIDAIYL